MPHTVRASISTPVLPLTATSQTISISIFETTYMHQTQDKRYVKTRPSSGTSEHAHHHGTPASAARHHCHAHRRQTAGVVCSGCPVGYVRPTDLCASAVPCPHGQQLLPSPPCLLFPTLPLPATHLDGYFARLYHKGVAEGNQHVRLLRRLPFQM